jgi:transposase-like protein
MAAEDATPFYRDRDRLLAEVERHGSVANAARAHGFSPNTVQRAWSNTHRLPRLPPGPRPKVSVPDDPSEEVSQEEILRARVVELERALRQTRTGDVHQARLIEAITSAVKVAAPRFKPAARRRAKGDEEEAALLLSDTHASEVVKAEQTLGMNAYDWDVMLHRLARLQTSMLSHLAHFSAPVRRLHLWCLGDMLSGDIHEELSATNDRPGAQAAVDFGHELARFVEELVPEFEEIVIAGVPGNHPRATKKQQAKDAHNNGDWVAYKVAEALLAKYPSVACSFPPASYAVAAVAERWRVLLMHGDGIRSTMPGVPWGGVVRRVTVLEQQFAAAKQPLDYVCMGHFHTANALDGVGIETFLNGSVKGLDEYSLKAFGSGRRPQQRLLTFHPKHGVTGMRWLNLTDHEPAQGLRAAA